MPRQVTPCSALNVISDKAFSTVSSLSPGQDALIPITTEHTTVAHVEEAPDSVVFSNTSTSVRNLLNQDNEKKKRVKPQMLDLSKSPDDGMSSGRCSSWGDEDVVQLSPFTTANKSDRSKFMSPPPGAVELTNKQTLPAPTLHAKSLHGTSVHRQQPTKHIAAKQRTAICKGSSLAASVQRLNASLIPRTLPPLLTCRMSLPAQSSLPAGHDPEAKKSDTSLITDLARPLCQFLSEGNYSPPRDRVLLYREVPLTMSSLREALAAKLPPMGGAEGEARSSPRASVSPKKQKSNNTFSIARKSKQSCGDTAPFFSLNLSTGSSPFASRAFVEMPSTTAPSADDVSSTCHLLYHEKIDFEEDLLYYPSTADVPSSPSGSPLQRPLAGGNSLAETGEYLSNFSSKLRHFSTRPSVEMRRDNDAMVSGDQNPISAPVPSIPEQGEDRSATFLQPAQGKGMGGLTFVLPPTLVRYSAMELSGEAKLHQQATESNKRKVIRDILESNRRAAVQATLALGADHLSNPRKQQYLRFIYRSEQPLPLTEQRGIAKSLIETCVTNPLRLTSSHMSQPFPLLVDCIASPVPTTTIQVARVLDKPRPISPSLSPRRMLHDKDLPSTDYAFILQINKLIKLTLCEETRDSLIAKLKREMFVHISSPSHAHESLVRRVAQDIQHFVNTGQHDRLVVCHFVDGPDEHYYVVQSESPRLSGTEELLLEEYIVSESNPSVKWRYFLDVTGALAATTPLPGALSTPSVLGTSILSTPRGAAHQQGGKGRRVSIKLDDSVDGANLTPEASHLLSSLRRELSLSDEGNNNDCEPTDFSLKLPSLSSLVLAKDSPSALHGVLKKAVSPSDDSLQKSIQRASKSFGGAVKVQRMRRLASLHGEKTSDDSSQQDDDITSLLKQVEQGKSIQPSLKGVLPLKPSATTSDEQPRAHEVEEAEENLEDSLDDLLLAKPKPNVLLLDTVVSHATSANNSATSIPLTPAYRRNRATASRPVVEGTIVTGRKKAGKKKLSPDQILTERLNDLFARYGLAARPLPGALSQQSPDALRRCAGCIFEKPHAFCTNCGLLLCMDCFYFVHRPLNETFAWYSNLRLGRIKALVTTEFLNADGNEFRHNALSVETLFRMALDGNELSNNVGKHTPLQASASLSLTQTGARVNFLARTAYQVLDRFRTICTTDPENRLVTLAGGGLADNEFRSIIDDVMDQLEDRLHESFGMVAASEEFQKVKDESKGKSPSKKKPKRKGMEEERHFVETSIRLFEPSQLSHILEVIAKFSLLVPNALHRLVVGHDTPVFNEPSKAANKSAAGASLLGPAGEETDPPMVSDAVDELVIQGEIKQWDDDEDEQPQPSNSPPSPLSPVSTKSFSRRASRPVVNPAHLSSQGKTLSDLNQFSKRRQPEGGQRRRTTTDATSEPLSLHYDEEDRKPKVSSSVFEVPDHLAVASAADTAVEEVVAKGPSVEELRDAALKAMDETSPARAQYFREKIGEQSSCRAGNVVIVAVSQFAQDIIVPSPQIATEAERLAKAFTAIEYSVDVMHGGAAYDFLIPTVENVKRHIKGVQETVALEELASKSLLVIVLSRGVVARTTRAFPQNELAEGNSDEVASLLQFPSNGIDMEKHRTSIAFAHDTVITEGRVSIQNVFTKSLILSLRDRFGRHPVMLIDCWPISNVAFAIDDEGSGFGHICGRVDDNMVATELLCNYLPKQGGILAYYLLRALSEGRGHNSRIVEGRGSIQTTAKGPKESTPATPFGIDNYMTLLDFVVFVAKRIENKGLRLLVETGRRKFDDTSSTEPRAVSPKKEGRAISPRGNRKSSLVSPRRQAGLAANPFAQFRDELLARAKRVLMVPQGTAETSDGSQFQSQLPDDFSAPLITFPGAVCDKIILASLHSSSNPFQASKMTEMIFDVTSRRFHLTVYVKIPLTSASSRRYAGASPVEDDTVNNLKWRRSMMSQIQAVVNGSCGVTRNGRPLKCVLLRAQLLVVIDFGSDWEPSSPEAKLYERFAHSVVGDAEKLMGVRGIYDVKLYCRSGVAHFACPDEDSRWALTQSIASLERKSVNAVHQKTYVPVTFSFLGTNRDYRRLEKALALQSTGGSGNLLHHLERDVNAEELHLGASKIQALFRGIRTRLFFAAVGDCNRREARVRELIESQSDEFMRQVAAQLRRVSIADCLSSEAAGRRDVDDEEQEVFAAVVEKLLRAVEREERIDRKEIAYAEQQSYLILFEVPNRWLLLDDEQDIFGAMMQMHRLLFRQMWQRYYVRLEEHQERVKLRTEGRQFVTLMPKLFRVPAFARLEPPPCDFDFASSLVTFPQMFRQLYLKARRAIDETEEETTE